MNEKTAIEVLKNSNPTLSQIASLIDTQEELDIPESNVSRYPGDTGYTINDPDFFTRKTIIEGVVHRPHPNGGGLVAETATVEPTAFVGVNARVYGTAMVLGNARIFDNAQVCDNARVYDNARVSGNTYVCGDVRVCGDDSIQDNKKEI